MFVLMRRCAEKCARSRLLRLSINFNSDRHLQEKFEMRSIVALCLMATSVAAFSLQREFDDERLLTPNAYMHRARHADAPPTSTESDEHETAASGESPPPLPTSAAFVIETQNGTKTIGAAVAPVEIVS